MKLSSLLVSVVLLAIGWSLRWTLLAVCGAILYILVSAVGLIGVIRHSIAYRRGKLKLAESGEKKSMIIRLPEWLNNIIFLSSLPAMVIGRGGNIEAFSTSAAIIWFGSLAIYVVAGFIIKFVGDVPLEMTYGGWKVRSSRRWRR